MMETEWDFKLRRAPEKMLTEIGRTFSPEAIEGFLAGVRYALFDSIMKHYDKTGEMVNRVDIKMKMKGWEEKLGDVI